MTSNPEAIPEKEALNVFDQCIQNAKEDGADPERIAKLEVVREFFCNPKFRKDLSDFVWGMNK